MVFVGLLSLVTALIAFAAAYFSVYGLAATFGGVFWSVVFMGASLEAGKLIAASYLYRYWTETHTLLKTYLIAGIAALMLLTSTGIFGYLSSGYQQELIPLKQQQVQLTQLQQDRDRILARKLQIEQLLVESTSIVTNTNSSRVLREQTRSRELLAKQYGSELKGLNDRLTTVDQQISTIETKVVAAESHIGPIVFIASAFGLDTDNATKYLIMIIVFAFDPMAVALTLATNNAIRVHSQKLSSGDPPPTATEETPHAGLYDLKSDPAPADDGSVLDVLGMSALPDRTGDSQDEVVEKMVAHLRFLKQKQADGQLLTPSERAVLHEIEQTLHEWGYSKHF